MRGIGPASGDSQTHSVSFMSATIKFEMTSHVRNLNQVYATFLQLRKLPHEEVEEADVARLIDLLLFQIPQELRDIVRFRRNFVIL